MSFGKYTELSDRALDEIISEIKRKHPNDGERLLIGHPAVQKIILP